VASRSKARVCGRSLAGLESRRGHRCLSVVSVVCCPVEVSATGRLLVQKSRTEPCMSEGDREASIMRRPWPTKGCCFMEGELHLGGCDRLLYQIENSSALISP
jgi:hypothetical protein